MKVPECFDSKWTFLGKGKGNYYIKVHQWCKPLLFVQIFIKVQFLTWFIKLHLAASFIKRFSNSYYNCNK